jgi:hypothetical protein
MCRAWWFSMVTHFGSEGYGDECRTILEQIHDTYLGNKKIESKIHPASSVNYRSSENRAGDFAMADLTR